jgi:hypothetical protein
VLLVLLVLAFPAPLWLDAGLATLLVVVALDPTGVGLQAGSTRLLATAEAAVLLLVGATLLVWLGRWPPPRRAEHDLVEQVVAAQTAS